jgi:nucleotide-binding universal stress UspA family protein
MSEVRIDTPVVRPSGRAGSATHSEDEAEPGVLLVAVGLGAQSRAALCWAEFLSRSLGLGLRLVHAAQDPLASALGDTANEDLGAQARSHWLRSIRESVHSWAACEAGVRVAFDEVLTDFGAPLDLILAAAEQPDVKMLVLGGPPSGTSPALRDLPRQLLRRCPCPLLFVGSQGLRPVVMAATDCSDPKLPVFIEAWRMAAALGDRLVVVHNVDHAATQFTERIGLLPSPTLADTLAYRSRQWLQKSAAVGDVVITRDSDNAQGVLAAAQRLDADLLVVGVKPESKAPHRTAEQILAEVQRTVLFVPFAGSRTAEPGQRPA